MKNRKIKKTAILNMSEKLAISILVLFHLTGFLLLNFSSGLIYSIALDFVPINIILSTLLVVKFQIEYNARFFGFMAFTLIIGLAAEIIGVNTGWIFGNYSYGEVLGLKIFSTPLLIGLNWFLVAYCTISIIDYLPTNSWIKYLMGIFLLVLLDYFIEPTAIRLGFWNWENGNIPIRNYYGWAAVSGLILAIGFLFPFSRKNKVAAITFLLQLTFFMLQTIF